MLLTNRMWTSLWIMAVLFALAVVGGSAKADAVAHFREIEQSHSSLGEFADSPETWRTAVLLTHGTKVVGTGVFTCTRVEDSNTLRRCGASYILPQGQIEASGIVRVRDHFDLLVTADSGIYDGKRGSIHVSRIGTSNPRNSFVTFFFTN